MVTKRDLKLNTLLNAEEIASFIEDAIEIRDDRGASAYTKEQALVNMAKAIIELTEKEVKE